VNNGTNVVIYTYDPFGRRIEKNVNGVITQYVYSTEGLIGEYDAGGNITRTYGYHPSSTFTTDPLFMKQGSEVYFYHNDGSGTPQKMTNSSGIVVWQATYSSFGKTTVDGNSTITNNIRFPGQYFDSETGLHYNFHRFYDPEMGRYITRDPIEGSDYNLYVYTGNNPVNKYDPMGLAHCTLIFSNGNGRLTCVPDNPPNQPVDIPVASGNNRGGSKCKNNPDCDNRPDTGPIPAGDWVWTNGYSTKPDGRVLEPLPGTNTHGRLNIQSHSCANAFGPSKKPPFCSACCVTGQAGDIQKLNALIDAEPGSTLHVGE